MAKMNSLPPNFKFQFDKYLADESKDRDETKNNIDIRNDNSNDEDINSIEITYEHCPRIEQNRRDNF